MLNERATLPPRKLKLSPLTVRILLAASPSDGAGKCECKGETSSGGEAPGDDSKVNCTLPVKVSATMPICQQITQTITTITKVTTVTKTTAED